MREGRRAGINQYWWCQCDCGSPQKEVLQSSLRVGVSQSCGCKSREVAGRLAAARLGSKAGDLVDRRFGMLTVLSRAVKTDSGGKRRAAWLCLCDCGTEKVVGHHELTRRDNKHATSCGEHRAEQIVGRTRTHGEASLKSDLVTPEYRSWCAIKARCCDSSNPSWPRYGGRGIVVCEKWRDSYEAFLSDMGRRPSASHSIDRIDNNRGYEPINCRWATKIEQARNRRSSRILTIDGVSKTLAEWAEVSGVHHGTIQSRLGKSMSPKDAVFRPPMATGRHRKKAA